MFTMRRLTLLIVVAANLAFAASALACPFCKDTIANTNGQSAASATGGGLQSGFNDSIYLMFISLFAMTGMVVFTMVKGARTSASARPVEPPQDGRGFPLE